MFGSILTAKVSIQMPTDSWMQVIYHGNVYSAECQICSFLSGFNFVSLFGDDVAFGKPGLLNSEQLLRFEY
jgi:hypothetical protein